MSIHEAFNNFISERLAHVKASPKYSELLKQANAKEDFLLNMLDGAQGELFLELRTINQQIYANDEADAYRAGFLDALTLWTQS